jgi:hypothetical protein
MPIQALQNYTWRGARALVLIHEKSMRDFLSTWRRAKAANVKLPPSDNAAYASLETVLLHALKASRNMLTWICEKLALPDPGVNEAPDAAQVGAEVDRYVEHLLERWRLPFAAVDSKQFDAIHKDKGGRETSLVARLEHAVLHAQRHEFQLRELMEAK